MTAARSAVFVSYASQDVAAAKRLAEALRADGIEVWFDQDELVGGDAWDAKIRRQIGACGLFLPVISANTQARLEGYFRLEWKIAAQRTHTMADEKAFILPIVIDGTRDADAKVPPEFKAVQWTRLPDGETTPAFRARVQKLLSTEDDAAEPAIAAYTPAGSSRTERNKIGRWIGYGWAALGIGMGLFFALRPAWWKRSAAAEKPSAPATAAAPAATAPAAPKLDPQRVVLTRFENLTGDASLDPLARVIESELIRGLAPVQVARVLPVETAGRTAGRAAARETGAASLIVGSYLKVGDQLEVTAEIVLTADGDLFGSAGPVAVSPTALRGPGFTELTERLATGLSNAVITLQYPPTRISSVIYNRPWPRHPQAARLAAMRNSLADKPDELIAGYRTLLAEAPELLKVKHDLARLLRDRGQFDEAQKLFRELLGADRSRLAETEILGITYDDAMLAGDPDRALVAARALVELRPQSDAITQVVACLWAQNRPRAAFEALTAWWQKTREGIPEANRLSSEAGIFATQAFMELQEGKPAEALKTIARLEERLAGQPFASLHWLRFSAYGALGREDEQRKLVAEAASLSGSARVDPIILQWMGYSSALHAGRPEAARRWLDDAVKTWEEIVRSGQPSTTYDTLAIWLNEAAGRPEEALAAIERVARSHPGLINIVGARALVLRTLGRTEEAAAEERRLETWERRNLRGLAEYWRARIAARAGDKERAVALLRQAVAGGIWFGGFNSPTFEYGRSEPEFAPLRGYAPFEELLRPKG